MNEILTKEDVKKLLNKRSSKFISRTRAKCDICKKVIMDHEYETVEVVIHSYRNAPMFMHKECYRKEYYEA